MMRRSKTLIIKMYSLRRWLKLRNGDTMVVVVVLVMMMEVMTHVAGKFMIFMYGMSNDGRCNDSSSKNECNRKFNLSHF